MFFVQWSVALACLIGLLLGTAACRRRGGEAGGPDSGVPMRTSSRDAAPEGAAPLQGATQMQGAQEAALAASHKSAVKPWSQMTAGEKEDSYSYWLHQYQFGDAARKAQIVAEIRKAGLSPAELKTLQEMGARFGFAPLRL